MRRLSIDITPEDHQKIKAIAAIQGLSIKDYVLARIMPYKEDSALKELETYLEPRIKAAEQGHITEASAQDIFEETLS